MYVKAENGAVLQYPYTIGHLKKENPNTSFPANIPDETLALFGVFKVHTPAYPNQDHTKNVTEGMPVFVDNQWTVSWVVTDATQEEVEEKASQKSAEVRVERNSLLAASDWTQGKDIPDNISSAWATYRQALRDITAQAEFPWGVQWPTQPE